MNLRAQVCEVDGRLPCPTQPGTERRSLHLVLRDDQGHEGFGEASPLPGYSPDTLEEAHADLLAVRFDRYDGTGLRWCETIRSASARFAAETAIADLSAKRTGTSVARFLNPNARKSLELSTLVTPQMQYDEVKGLIDSGFRCFKLKVRGRPEDLERAERLRTWIGADAELRLDANRTLSLPRDADYIAALRQFSPTFIEEPLAEGTQDLIPFALDESLVHAETLPDPVPSALVALVLKPTVLGGFVRCLGLAERGRSLGLEIVVTHTFEGQIAAAAAAALALAIPATTACGLANHLDAKLATYTDTKWPGLGVDGILGTP